MFHQQYAFIAYAMFMDETRHHYCNVCHKNTDHILKTHYDGTISQECLLCHNIELSQKGHDYRKFEKGMKKENKQKNLVPSDSLL